MLTDGKPPRHDAAPWPLKRPAKQEAAEDTPASSSSIKPMAFTDFLLIASGTNERQTQAIVDEIELRLKHDFGAYPDSVEGRRQASGS